MVLTYICDPSMPNKNEADLLAPAQQLYVGVTRTTERLLLHVPDVGRSAFTPALLGEGSMPLLASTLPSQ